MTKGQTLGRLFKTKQLLLHDFGVPGGSLGEALRSILGRKTCDEKNKKKHQQGGKPRRISAGTVPRTRSFHGFFGVRRVRSNTASFPWRAGGGRIEPAEPESAAALLIWRVGNVVVGMIFLEDWSDWHRFFKKVWIEFRLIFNNFGCIE